jgi:hypothetical protein
MNLVSRGSKPYGQRLSECAAMDGFFLKRSKQELIDMFPVSEQVRGARAGRSDVLGAFHTQAGR